MNFDGFYLVDKQKDWTSFDVCARMRKICGTRKIGHTGTLDPFATGLLIVAVGKCTRLIPFLEKAKKTYTATILLGKMSPTLDPESEITDVAFDGKIPTKKDIEKIIDKNFLGEIEQIPPQYSALKIGGKKCCDMARKGEKIEMKPRPAEVFRAEILEYNYPELKIELEVAAGFYVRAFARDIGEKLVGGGICSELRRTAIENISIEDALLLEMCTDPIDPKFILETLPQTEIPTGRVQDFIAGRAFPWSGLEGEKSLVLVGGRTIGLGEIMKGMLQPRVVL
jgi:tRNA pseudouridine55 synthase